MSEKQPWLGMCRIDKDDESFETIIAVFTVDREAYEESVKSLMESKGFHLVWAEEVFPAGEWITRHPKERSASGLARAIHDRHLVEVGTLRTVGEEGEPAPDPEYLTITEHEIPPLPEQDDVPFWDKEWIAPELKELLFGQPEEGEKLRTYFIVDATLRKNITGVFDLDALDVPVQCFFKGEKAEELKEVAPYLIDMTLPDGAWDDKDIVPAFHKSFFDKHWGQNTGMFIRTSAPFEDVWKHFRKFPRVQIEEDKRWVYFRFWDPRIAPSYFSNIKTTPEKVVQWVKPRESAQVSEFIGNVEQADCAWVVSPNHNLLEDVSSVGMPMLSNIEMEGFRNCRIDRFANQLVEYFKGKDAYHASVVGDKNLKEIVLMGIKQAKEYGITRESPVKLYVHLMLGLGASFDRDPMLPWANNILAVKNDQNIKATDLRKIFIPYVKETYGIKGEFLQSFVLSLSQKTPSIKEDETSKSTREFISSQYPAKSEYIGSDSLERLISHTAQICLNHGLKKGQSLFILSCLRFVYGAGCIDDLQHKWIGKAVKEDPETGNKDDRLHKMFVKFMGKVGKFTKGVVE